MYFLRPCLLRRYLFQWDSIPGRNHHRFRRNCEINETSSMFSSAYHKSKLLTPRCKVSTLVIGKFSYGVSFWRELFQLWWLGKRFLHRYDGQSQSIRVGFMFQTRKFVETEQCEAKLKESNESTFLMTERTFYSTHSVWINGNYKRIKKKGKLGNVGSETFWRWESDVLWNV
jgi:hypothetical protein